MSVSSRANQSSTTGLVLKAYSNFAEVLCDGQRLIARMRGRLRLDGKAVLTGDRVGLALQGEGKALITNIEPRRTQLVRPPVANIDLAIIVFTTESPPLNPGLVDRLLILARHAGLDAVLCLNKIDLAAPDDLAAVRATYAGAGFPLLLVSAVTNANLNELVRVLGTRVAVLAGQSGVGKSTLLNTILPDLDLAVGELSRKVQRGRHTTRSVQLLPVGAGWIADAPGFVQLDLPPIEPNRLQDYYPEFAAWSGGCRFDDCQHDQEPDCRVKAAVESGQIDDGRYRRYLEFLHELQARPRY
jgi:ribosome biogenesis GTPase